MVVHDVAAAKILASLDSKNYMVRMCLKLRLLMLTTSDFWKPSTCLAGARILPCNELWTGMRMVVRDAGQDVMSGCTK